VAMVLCLASKYGLEVINYSLFYWTIKRKGEGEGRVLKGSLHGGTVVTIIWQLLDVDSFWNIGTLVRGTFILV
jgi:hypothetical protein